MRTFRNPVSPGDAPDPFVTYDGETSFLGARVVAKRSDGSLIGVIANKVAMTDDNGNQLYYDPETGGTTTRNTGAIHALSEWVDYDIDIGSPGDIMGIPSQDGGQQSEMVLEAMFYQV